MSHREGTEMAEVLPREMFVEYMVDYLADHGYRDTIDNLLLECADEMLEDYLESEEIEYGDEDYAWDESAAKTVVDEVEFSCD